MRRFGGGGGYYVYHAPSECGDDREDEGAILESLMYVSSGGAACRTDCCEWWCCITLFKYWSTRVLTATSRAHRVLVLVVERYARRWRSVPISVLCPQTRCLDEGLWNERGCGETIAKWHSADSTRRTTLTLRLRVAIAALGDTRTRPRFGAMPHAGSTIRNAVTS